MNYEQRRVARANEVALLCMEHGIRFENINMIGMRIYYSENSFRWFKCTFPGLDEAEDFVISLVYGVKERQSTLGEF